LTETFDVPAWLAEHARRFYADDSAPAQPRLASTVVLLRPTSQEGPGGSRGAEPPAGRGFEVYAIRRAATMAFAPSLYAFPGGGVDPRDAAVQPAWVGPPPAQWAARLGLDEGEARAVVCAAVREVFEESGVLLAGPDESTVVGDVSGADWEAAREALVARRLGFAELLTERGLALRSDLLGPWARWLTPEFEPRRYDTYFFLAMLPDRQVTRAVGGEADHTVWAAPAVLAQPSHAMLPPTRVTLRQLAAYPHVAAAMTATGGRDARTIIMPSIELGQDGQGRLVVPV
jgi:8-oxo-dGTP pyrophosphatase MutT (NUDIX family)